jgi:hypothetical protein
MVFLNGIFSKKKTEAAPPPPPRSFDMDNIFDVIEYCILKEPENATAIITQFLTDNPDQLEKRYTQETKPERGAHFYRSTGSTPLMMLLRYNQSERTEIYDYTENGKQIGAPIAIFEWALFENLIALGADINAKCDKDISMLFHTTADNKNITVKLLESGLEYNSYFTGDKRSMPYSYDYNVHYAIQEFESRKFMRHDEQTVALSHIFYTKSSPYYPSGDYNFREIANSKYIQRKRLLIDFAQNAVHRQDGHDGNQGYDICQWRTKDIESFDTYLNQDLINRARAFMDSGKGIETAKIATSNIAKRNHAPTIKSPIT